MYLLLNKKNITIAVIVAALLFFTAKSEKTTGQIFQPQNILNNGEKILLLPLDSRPPCTQMVTDLGRIAGVEINLPKSYLLDNYRNPANFQELRQWAYNNINNYNAAIVSTDLLIHGGLIGSRRSYDYEDEQKKVINLLAIFHEKNPTIKLYAFSIIPRLIIADDEKSNQWQYHMLKFAILQDQENTFGNPLDYKKLEELRKKIPEELIVKYNKLYENNNKFNHDLIEQAQKDWLHGLIIGQDDGEPFGLPNINRNKAVDYINTMQEDFEKVNSFAMVTRGADEIGMLLLAAHVNKSKNYQPKIFVKYSDPTVPHLVMPYMPITVNETVNEKIENVFATRVDNEKDSDFILFVHCGHNKTMSWNAEQISQEVKTLLQGKKPIALVDLSENYQVYETLLDKLVKNGANLPKLIAYAGWNTTSNSVGTAISQASIFMNRINDTPQNLLPSIYYHNFRFTLARIIDDWGYQKNILPNLNKRLIKNNIDNYKLGKTRESVEDEINKELDKYSQWLVENSINKFPFYVDGKKEYYIYHVEPDATLTWDRTFEIRLDLTTQSFYR